MEPVKADVLDMQNKHAVGDNQAVHKDAVGEDTEVGNDVGYMT